MRVTLVHPAIGHRPGERYFRSWQMEPLQQALLAALTPADVELRFYDDRMEPIPFEEPTDLAAISVETYTARRAYQIASDFRRRGVPVVMGGFHASLCPDEVGTYAEAVVTGEAESLWPAVIEDARVGRLRHRYDGAGSPTLQPLRYDRTIFKGRRYLPVRLVEGGRGCKFRCEFCAVQSFYGSTHRRRPLDAIVREVAGLREETKVFFFVDDNFAADLRAAKDLLRELIPLRIRWMTQMSINAAHDEEFLALLAQSGCAGVLIGFESLSQEALRIMGKSFNTAGNGYRAAIANLRRHGIRLYATFVFGYDGESATAVDEALDFALQEKFFIAAFNHLTPFPGTPLYRRLETERRLLHHPWWLDADYGYNRVPFRPLLNTPEGLQAQCVAARRRFYSASGILRRLMEPVHFRDPYLLFQFLFFNCLMRMDVKRRNHFPLGDTQWRGELLPAQ